jgi:hypothetical protein
MVVGTRSFFPRIDFSVASGVLAAPGIFLSSLFPFSFNRPNLGKFSSHGVGCSASRNDLFVPHYLRHSLVSA